MSLLLAMIAVAVSQAPDSLGETDAPHRFGAALSCQLQHVPEGKKFNSSGDFSPLIIRFDGDQKSDSISEAGKFYVFDPTHLLREAEPKRLYLKPSHISVTTSLDGPEGILDFTATDFEHAGAPVGTTSQAKGKWFASVALIGNSADRYRALGPCIYSTGVGALSDEVLIMQRANK